MTNSAFSLLFVVASFGPGYVFVRVSETRALAPERSQFFESVEMAVFGSFCSVLAASVLVSLTGVLGILDAHALVQAPRAYAAEHAVGVSVGVFGYLALSNSLGYLLATRVFFRDSEQAVRPGHSAWTTDLVTPPENGSILASVALRNGMQVHGLVSSVVSDDSENRELALKRPIAIQPDAKSEVTEVNADVLVLRERDISFIVGRRGVWPAASE